ncbi:MAG: hypothetical protein ACOYJU_08220, partial [Anaerovoracaceae bacterium]
KIHKNITSIFSNEQTNGSLVFWSGRYGRTVVGSRSKWPNPCYLIAAQPPPLQKSSVAKNTDKTHK